MYTAWAGDHEYSTELMDRQDNEVAGINSATIAVRGPMAYGYLKGEEGIHRLVRISPFNSEGKRQDAGFASIRRFAGSLRRGRDRNPATRTWT